MGYNEYWQSYKKGKGSSSKSLGTGESSTEVSRRSSLFLDDWEWDEHYYSGQSLSSSSKYYGFGSWNSTPSILNSEIDMLNDAACKTIRLLNSVNNSSDGNENTLRLVWASNKPEEDAKNARAGDILISPDKVIEMKAGPEIVDAVGGKALMMATMRRTEDKKSKAVAIGVSEHAKSDPASIKPEGHLALPIYEAIESSIAKQDLLTNWPGSVGYVYRNQAVSCASQQQVEDYIKEQGDCAESAVAALSWILNNPKNPITLSPAIDDALSEILTTKIPSVGNDGRWQTSVDCAKHIIEKLPPKSTPPPPSSGGGNGEGSGIPNSSDSEVTLGIRKSSHERKDLPEAIDTKEDLDKFDVPKIPDGCAVCTHLQRTHPKKGFYAEPDPIVGFKTELPSAIAYSRTKKFVTKLTDGIVQSMRFRATERAYDVLGTTSGEFDEGNLHKITLRRNEDPHIYRRNETVAFPNVLVGILVDMSGSMDTRSRYAVARQIATAFHEAMKRLKGVGQYIAGHHTYGPGVVKLVQMYKSGETSAWSKPESIMEISPIGANADGYALQMFLTDMGKMQGYAHKIAILVSDGQPSANGDKGDTYGGEPAMKHIKNVCDWGQRKYSIRTVGIGIDNAYTDNEGAAMFGNGNFAIVPDTMGSIPIIKRLLVKVTAKIQ